MSPEPLLCPSCNYDLRATATTSSVIRCTECGLDVDPARPYSTAWPWARRRSVASYLLTTWLLAIGHPKLALEHRKAQDQKRARAFRRITAYLVSVSLLSIWLCGWFAHRQKPFKLDPRLLIPDDASPFVQEWTMPLSTGLTLAGVLPAMIIILAVRIVLAPARILKSDDTAQAIACYLPGLLSWLALPAALLAVYTRATWGLTRSPLLAAAPRLTNILTWLIAAIIALHLGWITVWKKRISPTSWRTAPIQLLAIWTWESLLWLAIVPWTVGFLWIVFETLR